MHIDAKKIFKKISKNNEIYEDMSFLIPQALDYYNVIDDAQSVIPYATVGIVLDSAKLIKNITDIINNRSNISKLENIRQEFGDGCLIREIQKIDIKNKRRSLKEVSLNVTRCTGDILCFAFLTWIYGESAKISATAAEILIEWSKRVRQKGRDLAKEKGRDSIYAKIFNMEKSTGDKIKKKCKIISLLDEELIKYLDIIDNNLKNKELKKLELYVKILSRYKSSFGVRKEWNEILEGRLHDKNLEKNKFGNLKILEDGDVPFMTSFVDIWQFQRFVLILEFTNEMKKSITSVSARYTLRERLKEIQLSIINKDECELVGFLIKYNKRKLKRLTSSMMILGSSIVGELGEFAAYFKDTVFEIIGIFVKACGVILREGVHCKYKITKRKSRKNRKIIKYADQISNIIKNIESLSLDYRTFHEIMTRVYIYLNTIGLDWVDVANKDVQTLRMILINALIT